MLKLKITVAVTLLLAGCTSFSDRRAAEEQGRRVAAGGIYKIGTPYEIEGDWYYPQAVSYTHLTLPTNREV